MSKERCVAESNHAAERTEEDLPCLTLYLFANNKPLFFNIFYLERFRILYILIFLHIWVLVICKYA